jgi:hypothetical protein
MSVDETDASRVGSEGSLRGGSIAEDGAIVLALAANLAVHRSKCGIERLRVG